MPLTMPKPVIPVRTNRTIQLRRMNMSNPDDMQKFVTGARTSETRPFVRSQNEAVSRHRDTTLSHWFDEQCLSVDKLCRRQDNTYGKLALIEHDKRRAEEVKHRKMAPRKVHLATEDRGQQYVTARRDAIYPKLTDSIEVSTVSHILHSAAEVLDESAHGKGNGGGSCNKTTNAHVDTIQKVDSWCRSTKEAMHVGQTSDAGHVADGGSNLTSNKVARGLGSFLYVGSSSRQAIDTAIDDNESQAHGSSEQGSQAHRRLEQAKRRQQRTLDEPFTTYRRGHGGRLVVSELPYRRKTFPMPGRKVPSILPKLRKLAINETEKNRQRMVLFAEGLVKFDEWDPLQYVRSLRPPEEREHEVAPLQHRKDLFTVNDVFNRYYAQLLDGLDPDSAEAMKYCRYIRVDGDKTQHEENLWD